MKARGFIFSGIFLAILVTSGCATTQPLRFSVGVDSLSSTNANEKKSYILLPGNKDVSEDDLQFKEFSTYVDRTLLSRGFMHATNIERADFAVFIVYGVGNPQDHQYSYSLPIFGQTGVSSSTTYGQLSMYGNYGTYSGTTRYTPTYGVTGSSSRSGSFTTYFRFVVLDAIDMAEYRNNKKEVQLWKTTMTSTGRSGDLRQVFPILVAAAKQYIATNTGKKVNVDIDEEDDLVIEVKGIKKENKKPCANQALKWLWC